MICHHCKGLDGRRGDPWVPFVFLGKQEGWAHRSCEQAWQEHLREQRAKDAKVGRENHFKRLAFDIKQSVLDRGPEWKSYALLIFTGLVVSWAKQGLEHHFHKGFPSWGDFFVSWFTYTFVVLMVSGFAVGTIFSTHRFFLGSEYKDDNDRLFFYVVMTVLVAALLATFAGALSPD